MKISKDNPIIKACFYLYYIQSCKEIITWEDIEDQDFNFDMEIDHRYYQAFSPEAFKMANEKLNNILIQGDIQIS